MKIIQNVSQHKLIEDWQVPDTISRNPLWSRLSPLAKDIFILRECKSVTALLVVLRDTGIQLVVKTWSAERARVAVQTREVEAELDAAKEFAWHPLLVTLVAACYDDDGNFCSVLPYVGCALDDITGHEDWFETVSDSDRLEFMRLFLVQAMAAFDIMQKTGAGHFHRDVKPDNFTVNLTTHLVSVIDFGLMVGSNLANCSLSQTLGYFTPEMVQPGPNGRFDNFFAIESRKTAINNTTDVFLAAFVALEAVFSLVGLPWLLSSWDHDVDTQTGYFALLWEHVKAAEDGYYDFIAQVACPIARDFFKKAMCSDPCQRLTPAQALDHEWLASCRAPVQSVIDTATPALLVQSQHVAALLSGVPGVILPQQKQEVPELGGSAAGSVRSSRDLDVPCSSDSRCSTSPSDGDTCSSTAADTADPDQHPACAATASAAPKNKSYWASSLLQQGEKLLTKLSRSSSSKRFSRASESGKPVSTRGKGNDAAVGSTASPALVEVQVWVDDAPRGVSVPGLCGLRWFNLRRSKGSSQGR